MSVGIIQIPSLYEPAYGPNIYVVSGTNTPSGNYQAIARIHIPSGTIVAKLKNPTDPTYNQLAVFDVHNVIEQYVTHTIDIGIDRVTNAPNNIVEYLIEFGEEYGTTPAEYWTGTHVYPAYGLNVALSPREFNAYNYLNYLPTDTSSQFLNKYKGTRKVFTTTKAFLYFLSDQDHAIDAIVITAYDSAGAVIGSPAEVDTNITGLIRYFPAGPTNLNLIPQSQILSGTAGSLIPANTKTYTIYLSHVDARHSEIMTYEIIENCSKYTNYPIYFLGQYGNVEVWNFNRRSDEQSTIEKLDYKKPLGRFLNQFGHYGYEDTDRQLTTYNTEVQDTVTLNTDYLTDAEMVFLKECVQSPVVYSLESGVLIPVKIIDKQFTKMKKVNDRLFNLSITIDYSSTLELQRG